MKKFNIFLIFFIFLFNTLVNSTDLEKKIFEDIDVSFEITDLNFDANINEIDYNRLDSVNFVLNFGKYEQDNNTNNGKEDIEWVILKKTKKEAILLSRYILDTVKINKIDMKDKSIYWRNSNIRKWLNEVFFNEAFDSEEQQLILPQKNLTNRNYDLENNLLQTNINDITIDRVSILSIDDYYEYFGKYNTYPETIGVSAEKLTNDILYNDLINKIKINKRAATKKTEYLKNKKPNVNVLSEDDWNFDFSPYILRNFNLESDKLNKSNTLLSINEFGIIDDVDIDNIYLRPLIHILY